MATLISMERRLELAQEMLERSRRLRGTRAEGDTVVECLGMLLDIVSETVAEVKQLREDVGRIERP